MKLPIECKKNIQFLDESLTHSCRIPVAMKHFYFWSHFKEAATPRTSQFKN